MKKKNLQNDNFYQRLKVYSYYSELRETLSDISEHCGTFNAPEDGIVEAGDKIVEAIKLFDQSLENLRKSLCLNVIINEFDKQVKRAKRATK